MTQPTVRSSSTVIAYLLLAGLALVNGGCLLVAAGAAGGAAVSYAYYKGKFCETYNARFDDTWNAVRTGLVELGMPIESEGRDKGDINTHTAKGDHVCVHVEAVDSKIPAEGKVTRVCVRVATFGDEEVSARILSQLSFHLTPVTAVQSAPAGAVPSGVVQTSAPPVAVSPPLPSGVTVPSQTAPPPLLPSEQSPAKK